MLCPICNVEMKKTIFYGDEVDYCPQCLGMWFKKDGLRIAKDKKDKDLKWVDIELWEDKTKFKISEIGKSCPVCSVPLYSVKYGDSEIEVDVCNLCEGIWLNRGEFKKIINYLKEKKWYDETLKHYFKNLAKQGMQVFTGPEDFRSELEDFLIIFKILNCKFAIQYPAIVRLISMSRK
jgi:Zn-finger nucleic acid-binding protein